MGEKRMHPAARLRKIIEDAHQFVIDVQWWNANRTDAPPMDCEDMMILGRKARIALQAWDTGSQVEFEAANRDLLDYAENHVGPI